MHRFRRPIGLSLLVLAILLAGWLAETTQAASPEFRAYWVDAFHPGIYDEQQIDRLVADAKAANLNAIVVQVGRRGDCFCNKAIMPRTEAAIAPLPFDPLQSLIVKAHAQGIEVHAWISATGIWSSLTPPKAPNHVFNTHGPTKTGYDNWIMLRADGVNRGGSDFYLDPGHPGAADYIVRMATSIVENYDVDGINLDRIRYPDYNLGANVPSWGYNPVAVARFQAAAARSDTPTPTDPQWMQWRRDQITNVVRRIYLESYALKPHVRVSADTIVYGYGPQSQGGWTSTATYVQVLQDWRGWLAEGILDLSIPMNYKFEGTATEPSNQRRMYEEWNEFAKDNQYNRQTAIGVGLLTNYVEGSVVQVRKALAPSAAGNRSAGWVGYSYDAPDRLAYQDKRTSDESRAEFTRALTQSSEYDPTTPPVFASHAAVPPMAWKTQSTTGHLKGTIRSGDGTAFDRVRVELYDATTDVFAGLRSTDGSGWFGFVDLPPGRYKVMLGGARVVGRPVAVVDVVAGQITTAAVSLCPDVVPDGQFCVQYFDNRALGAPAVYATTEAKIDHAWAGGSPAPGAGADYFSARWQGTFSFDAADYTFEVTADDGVRVWVDDQIVIDEWRIQAPTTFLATARLSAGSHTVRMEYYEEAGGALARLDWFPYRAQYFGNTTLSGTPTVDRYEPGPISYDWGSGGPVSGVGPDNFSARWTGTFGFDSASYTFTATADDGVRLWVDGVKLIDQWKDQAPTRHQATVRLSAGYHTVKMEYYESGGGAVAAVDWSPGCPVGQFRADYFGNVSLSGTPTYGRCESAPVDHDWGSLGPGNGLGVDNFSARWHGMFSLDAGTHTFTATADDGVRVWVDGTLVIDRWRDQAPTTYTANVPLAAGNHAVKSSQSSRVRGLRSAISV